jgi:iron(III) transport system permease protein
VWRVLRRVVDRGYLGYVGVLLAGVLLVVVLAPIAIAVLTSLRTAPIGTPGDWTIEHYREAIGDSQAVDELVNTVIYALGASTLAVVLAATMAWTVTRIQVPGRRILMLLPLLSLAAPALLKDIAWIELYAPRSGLANIFFEQILGIEDAFNIYSMLGLIIVTAVYVVPVPYLILLAPFESLDPSLEEASLSSGAGRLRTQLAINARVLLPAFASSFALTVIVVAGTFEAPTIIGLPGGINTYMSSIYRSLTTSIPNFPLASAQSIFYLVLTFSIFIGYLLATRREQSFVTVTGRGPRKISQAPAWLKVLLVSFILFYFFVCFILPVGYSIIALFVPIYELQAGNLTGDWSLDIIRRVLSQPVSQRAILGSFEVACLVSIFAVLTGGVISYVALKTRVRGRRVAEIVGTLPVAMPGLVFSVTVLIAFVSISAISPLYNSVAPMIVIDVLVALPFTVRILSTALIQIDTDLFRASAVSGARPIRTIALIALPLLRGALLNALVISFMVGYRELSAILLIAPTNRDFLPPLVWNHFANGLHEEVKVLLITAMVVPLAMAAFVFGTLALWRLSSSAWGQRSAGPAIDPRPATH